MIAFLAVFLLPVAIAAGTMAYRGGPTHWWNWDRRVTSQMPAAAGHPQARIMVLAGRTRGWKGAIAVHTWIVVKGENEPAWRRYDVTRWGNPVRMNWWPPDLWFGERGTVVADISGPRAQALIPRIDAAIKSYSEDYRIWPGPNSNTFVAGVLRAVPELGVALPPTAVGRDFRPWPYAGLTDSGTGIEANLWGLLGVKLGWVEGVEINVLGLVAGLDLREPGVKLPGYGRIGPHLTATAATKDGR
ncbi:MAG: DUF3750 domain-containing protein [Alphaproteobacteria bacterium]|nr:DUF3750 domain-containing protein [Alphaproteobacteria bacterium]